MFEWPFITVLKLDETHLFGFNLLTPLIGTDDPVIFEIETENELG